ncbi:Polysaccharide deacetylase [Dethiosulfatibacter aminovorans DSM 17477]|uniref:Polysaccharide deacetylase n=2 Tax=Dethiosulfatibacter TaxID=448125 RepID=A0A1M6E8A1_9FIRM|nr:Polysaccharide deacetylase [Dethiosulfatibacter aminovorans DSM 17477]
MTHNKKRTWSFLSANIKVFENTLKYLKKNGYKSISLQELYDLRTKKISDDSKLFIITFDDGFLDNYTIAYPMLKKYGFKATVFVNPEFVDQRPVVREQIYDRIVNGEDVETDASWGYMSWNELKEIDDSGIFDVQCHGMTHTWYVVEPVIVDIHHSGDGYHWLWWNEFVDRKPLWLSDYCDTDIEIGTPVFKYGDSISAKRFFVNDDIVEFVKKECKGITFLDNKKKRLQYVNDLNREIDSKYRGNLGRYETDDEYSDRLYNEIHLSKEVIEKKLNKEVRFLAWTTGGTPAVQLAQNIAKDAGYYSATDCSKAYNDLNDDPFYVYRIGGFSGHDLFGKQSLLFEKAFIRMQLHRGSGEDFLFNRLLEGARRIYRRKDKKMGENNR